MKVLLHSIIDRVLTEVFYREHLFMAALGMPLSFYPSTSDTIFFFQRHLLDITRCKLKNVYQVERIRGEQVPHASWPCRGSPLRTVQLWSSSAISRLSK